MMIDYSTWGNEDFVYMIGKVEQDISDLSRWIELAPHSEKAKAWKLWRARKRELLKTLRAEQKTQGAL